MTTLRQRMLEDLQIRTQYHRRLPARHCRIRQTSREAARPTWPGVHPSVPTASEPTEARVPVHLHPGRRRTSVLLRPYALPAKLPSNAPLAQIREEVADHLEPAGGQSAAGAQKPSASAPTQPLGHPVSRLNPADW